MRTSEFKKLLRKHGCYFVSQGGRHEKWFSPITGNKFVVPRHDGQEIPTGTLQAIKKQAGI
ncbi:MAG: type II toxin-antitoxin system HicA family toxin [Bacteroidales bacterium]|nr:type II toxin-antitoxin system HicA family toxin [Bacteroidales bacterium]